MIAIPTLLLSDVYLWTFYSIKSNKTMLIFMYRLVILVELGLQGACFTIRKMLIFHKLSAIKIFVPIVHLYRADFA